MNFQNKTAIVTGAGSGIGRGIAIAFAHAGANIVVADISQEGEETVAAIHEAGGEAIFIQGDVTDPQYHVDLVAETKARYGKLDIAVNNAGISTVPTPLADIPVETWDKVISINLSGMFYGVRTQVPAMIEVGGGAIVNMSSIAGQVGVAGIGHYTASKHGVIGLTKNIAIEYAKQGIRANAVGPGYINTPLVDLYPPEERAKLASVHPMDRLGEVNEVAALVLWLAGPYSSFVTGTFIPVDGGRLAR
jgi:NAD(P)-dependent dehydrogenase (short-subunit alcohol dehydrogenase family)